MGNCSFFGHRKIDETPELCKKIRETVIGLIKEKGIENYLFSGMGDFDNLCFKVVTELKASYPEVKCFYIRSRYPNYRKKENEEFLKLYDDAILPGGIENAGKAVYVERNQAMINVSAVCVFYYNEAYKPTVKRKLNENGFARELISGTKIAYEYAISKGKEIVNLCL